MIIRSIARHDKHVNLNGRVETPAPPRPVPRLPNPNVLAVQNGKRRCALEVILIDPSRQMLNTNIQTLFSTLARPYKFDNIVTFFIPLLVNRFSRLVYFSFLFYFIITGYTLTNNTKLL